jgi:hypothetical protein
MNDHGLLTFLPDPEQGFLTDSHIRAVTFYAENLHTVLTTTADYLHDNDLEEYVSAIDVTQGDAKAERYIVTVFLEAGVMDAVE